MPARAREDAMNFKGYELQRLIAKLRIRGMYSDADLLEKDRRTNRLSLEAIEIIKKAGGSSEI